MSGAPRFTPAQLAAIQERQKTTPVPELATSAIKHAAPQGQEAKLQADCEDWLEFMGFAKRTSKGLAAGPPENGWQMHYPRAKGNPYTLDIVLHANDGRFLEIELKTKTGRPTKEQTVILATPCDSYVMVRSLDDFMLAVKRWLGIDVDDLHDKMEVE